MDASGIIAITVAASALVVAIGGQIVAIVTAWRTSGKIDAVATTTNQVVDMTQTIQKNTDGRADKQDNLILNLTEQVKNLTASVAEKKQDIAVRDERLASTPKEVAVGAVADLPKITTGH